MGFIALTKTVEAMSSLELEAHIEELHEMLDDAITEQNVRDHADPDMSDDYGQWDPPEVEDDGMSDVEADADTLRSAGWGTDEDYGYFGEDDY